jgi:hypothetical protein
MHADWDDARLECTDKKSDPDPDSIRYLDPDPGMAKIAPQNMKNVVIPGFGLKFFFILRAGNF